MIPRLHKVVVEARYDASLGFYDRLYPAAQALTEYADWQTDRLTVVLKDFAVHCSAYISLKRFGYEQDSHDEALETERVDSLLATLPNAINVREFKRIGYRRKYLLPLDIDYDRLVQIMDVKLFCRDDALLQCIPRDTTDLLYRTDAAEGDNRFHLTIGPVRNEEIPKLLTFNAENHLDPEDRDAALRKIVEGYPTIGVYFDVDMYHDAAHVDVDGAGSFIRAARARLSRMVADLTTYLFEESASPRR